MDFDAFDFILREYKKDFPKNYFSLCSAALEIANYLTNPTLKDKILTILNKEISKIATTERTPYVPTPVSSEKNIDNSGSSTVKKILGYGFLFFLFLSPAVFFFARNKDSSTQLTMQKFEKECSSTDDSFCQALKQQQCPSLESYIEHMPEKTEFSNFDPSELRALYGEERDLSISETRDFYHQLIEKIPVLRDRFGSSDCLEVARSMSNVRTNARIYTRERGSFLIQIFTQARDLFVYGHVNGPSFEDLKQKKSKHASSPEDLCESLIHGSQKSNEFYNEFAKS